MQSYMWCTSQNHLLLTMMERHNHFSILKHISISLTFHLFLLLLLLIGGQRIQNWREKWSRTLIFASLSLFREIRVQNNFIVNMEYLSTISISISVLIFVFLSSKSLNCYYPNFMVNLELWLVSVSVSFCLRNNKLITLNVLFRLEKEA